ncbi:MAG TPA: dynamin family protein [Terriglobales bacterium]|nr:dynamin family protein [Terriglobales bacterium]
MREEGLVHDIDGLRRIASLAERLGCGQIATDARSAGERIADGRFYVACVGQFKRGKSTLLNALMGKAILPSGTIPVTVVPTILRFGERIAARVRLEQGEWAEIAVEEIEQYVSELENPQNRKGVAALEVFVPNSLLSTGLCFVDTPGLGSVFEGNTAATHAFLPHIDAAIAVIGADPPLSGDELKLFSAASKQIRDILFVLNKADRVGEDERAAAVSFAQHVLQTRLQRPVPQIFEISALEQVQKGGFQRDWKRLLDSLVALVEHSGRRLIQDASARSLRVLSARLLAVIREERNALTRPFQDTERRIREMRETVFKAEQSLHDLSFLFSAEQQRISRAFADRRNAFLDSTRSPAHRDLDTALKSLPRAAGPPYRRCAMHAAQQLARQLVSPWLENERRNADEAYWGMTKRFTQLTNDFLFRVRSFGTPDLPYLPKEMNVEGVCRGHYSFQFYEFMHIVVPASPLRYLADLLLHSIGASRIDADVHEFLDRLLDTNSERVRNGLEARITDSRRRLESEIRATLRELIAVTERALMWARDKHAAGAAAVQSSLTELSEAQALLVSLMESHSPPLVHQ